MSNAASTCLEGFWWERIISPIPAIVQSISFLRTTKPTWLSAAFTMKTGRLPTACRWRMAAKSIVSPDRYLVGRQELIRYFMQTLQLTKQDLVILDRETNIGQPIFEEAQKPAWVWSSMQSTSVPIMLTISISCGTTTTSTNLPMLTRWTSLLLRPTVKRNLSRAVCQIHQPSASHLYHSSWGSCKLATKRKIAPHFLWLLPLVWRQKSILTG